VAGFCSWAGERTRQTAKPREELRERVFRNPHTHEGNRHVFLPEGKTAMATVFDDRKMSEISSALEKFADFINDSDSGAVPAWTDAASKIIIGSLRDFEAKLRERDTYSGEIEYEVGTATYAICELQSFVTGEKSDIANRKAARVYRDFLAWKIENLRRLERGF
jgi:hypothetical protein